ncbi:GspH/FimT family pseudopilin [Chitiniphilus purpureus]|uniref:Type II secretion system protein H n=1 Tax=Chitiniphilus purpureus TaxID=2981137 RepID=A0ABY6DJ09_9NEIS|nr:GspH/FimT family pseudopilin [Chitiniphilus sp. CD1]UXY14223.1 GspH/FimT family pseudopilin [Chitiniphilus sp. CD1]
MVVPSYRNRGFTLVEALLVVAILGIIAAIALPSFADLMDRKRVESAAVEFKSLVSFAKSESIKRNADVFILATTTGSWVIRASSAASCSAGAACDLRSMTPTQHPKITLAISTGLDGTAFSAIRMLPAFAGGVTATQTATFGKSPYQLSVQITAAGITRICVPTGQPALGGYPTC